MNESLTYLSSLAARRPRPRITAEDKGKIRQAFEHLELTGVDFKSGCNSCWLDALALVVLEARKRGLIASEPLAASPSNSYDLPKGGVVVGGLVVDESTPDEVIKSLLDSNPMLRFSIKPKQEGGADDMDD